MKRSMSRITAQSKSRVFPGRMVNVVDGDTYDLMIDVGFRSTFTDRFRHAHVDTWEVRGEFRELGRATTTHVEAWFSDALEMAPDKDWPLTLVTYKDETRGKYGRWLCEIINYHGQTLGAYIESVDGIKREIVETT